MRNLFIFVFLFSLIFEAKTAESDDLLISSIKNEKRSEKNIKRDKYRNPFETLTFFEIDRKKKFWKFHPAAVIIQR